MSKYMKNLSENLKDLMGDMTIKELAKQVNIPQPTLSRYLSCQRQITLDYLVVLADYFDTDIDILISRRDY